MVDIVTTLNLVQIIAGNAIGNTIVHAEDLIKDQIKGNKEKRAQTREARFDLLKSSYSKDKKEFINIYDKNKEINMISDYDCLIFNREYPFLIDDKNMKAKRVITKLSRNLFNIITSFNKDNFRALQTFGCHNHKKWMPLGMQILGKPEIVYTQLPLGEGKGAKPKNKLPPLKLKTPITLACNPHQENIRFLNFYEITTPLLSTSSKSKGDNDYMLYSLGIPLFDIIKKHQLAEKNSNEPTTPTDLNNQIEAKKLFLDLHPYKVKSNLVQYYHNKNEQVKALEIYSGKTENKEENIYKGFSGVIKVYFAKTEAKIINNFANAIDNYVEEYLQEKEEELALTRSPSLMSSTSKASTNKRRDSTKSKTPTDIKKRLANITNSTNNSPISKRKESINLSDIKEELEKPSNIANSKNNSPISKRKESINLNDTKEELEKSSSITNSTNNSPTSTKNKKFKMIKDTDEFFV